MEIGSLTFVQSSMQQFLWHHTHSYEEEHWVMTLKQLWRLNPPMYKPTRTPTVVQGMGGGGWLMEPPWDFIMLQYFEKFSPLAQLSL